MKTVLTLIILVFALSACTTVKPWEKGNLAKNNMQGSPISQKTMLDNHIYFSKEGASGGGQAAGGGCGCN